MQVIWKWELAVKSRQQIMMPKGAIVLGVQVQLGCPCIWAIVSPTQAQEKREIIMVGTGFGLPDDIRPMSYIGTFQQMDETLVFHVFDGGVIYD